ncbi:hypothetical protein [Flavobacterium urumqiense]|uniref:Uncharacterized protein n=1 Tax=Flavobacterium urumqiense TaxID=935224 RepID=A0A1H5Z577_9FLAO|nr:hypothetical protein [Flavobacterium urumqiense]SEG31432.1 hypothetical protein SAMN04488130_109107 [Flavobacterium urumqiense]
MLYSQLRMYAISMRFRELGIERIEEIRQRRMRAFLPEPIHFKIQPRDENFSNLYDRNGKLFELPKSKYHK